MKIKKGDKLEEITLPKDDGSIFNLSETKGKRVLVERRLKTNTWTNKEGDTRSKVYVVANSVQFLSPVNEVNEGDQASATMPKVNSKTKQQSSVEEEVEEFDSVPF